MQTEVPAPPAANRVRVTFVNESPVTVTPKLGTVTGTPLATGKSVTLTLTGPANVPNGDDSYTLTYPPRSGSMTLRHRRRRRPLLPRPRLRASRSSPRATADQRRAGLSGIGWNAVILGGIVAA